MFALVSIIATNNHREHLQTFKVDYLGTSKMDISWLCSKHSIYIIKLAVTKENMNPKNTKKSPNHENADANITCNFRDDDISRLGQSIYANFWLNPPQIATEAFSSDLLPERCPE